MQRLNSGLLAIAVALLAALLFRDVRATAAPEFATPYQAVVLTGGQVYYGRLENAAGLFPVLRDVFYIASQVNPETKQAQNVFVRRGKELHGPEYMVLNRQSIAFVEPVKDDSQVANFIAEQKKQAN
jgi:hypothetical protein